MWITTASCLWSTSTHTSTTAQRDWGNSRKGDKENRRNTDTREALDVPKNTFALTHAHSHVKVGLERRWPLFIQAFVGAELTLAARSLSSSPWSGELDWTMMKTEDHFSLGTFGLRSKTREETVSPGIPPAGSINPSFPAKWLQIQYENSNWTKLSCQILHHSSKNLLERFFFFFGLFFTVQSSGVKH